MNHESRHLSFSLSITIILAVLRLKMIVRTLRPALHRLSNQGLVSNKRWISFSQLTVEKTTDRSRFENRPKKEDLLFGTTLSDHMLMIEWEKKNGWGKPRIVPYQNLSLSPAATSLHYGGFCLSLLFFWHRRQNDLLFSLVI